VASLPVTDISDPSISDTKAVIYSSLNNTFIIIVHRRKPPLGFVPVCMNDDGDDDDDNFVPLSVLLLITKTYEAEGALLAHFYLDARNY
jgi:hypothetical protein